MKAMMLGGIQQLIIQTRMKVTCRITNLFSLIILKRKKNKIKLIWCSNDQISLQTCIMMIKSKVNSLASSKCIQLKTKNKPHNKILKKQSKKLFNANNNNINQLIDSKIFTISPFLYSTHLYQTASKIYPNPIPWPMLLKVIPKTSGQKLKDAKVESGKKDFQLIKKKSNHFCNAL